LGCPIPCPKNSVTAYRVAMLTWQNHWQAVKDYYLIVLKGP